MRDVFGKKLLRVFKEVNQNYLVAAWTKQEAINLLLTNTNSYSSISDVEIKSVKGCGYAGVEARIL